ncbi:MAG TPA: DUF305 domain-containing protein [Gemmatimonadaceae bacterium]|nr:DUF305 domain-containing protein [Gemmatimonadaceae bacterium]
MKTMHRLAGVASLVAAAAGAACSSAVRSAQTSVQSGAPAHPMTPAEQARADSGRMPFTAADVHFMSGMIHHHSQAIVMAGWAQTHNARPDVKVLAQRIDVAQRDEIAFMQRWLRERHQEVPDPLEHYAMGHDMADMKMEMMPGMLTPEQMKQLDAAGGPEFDRLFLTFMIQHHQGAITMVDQLFASPGAGQELYVFRFASDVNADQNTEIDRMRLMLGANAK